MKFHKAVVLLSGGIDSTVTLAQAETECEQLAVLVFRYGQKHSIEIGHAQQIFGYYRKQEVSDRFRFYEQEFNLRLWGGSGLTDARVLKLEEGRTLEEMAEGGIPNSYVPARNTIFLAFAMSLAEAIGVEAIYIGSSANDYVGYPDCRPKYFSAMQQVFELGTKPGTVIDLVTPLIFMNKKQIISRGLVLNAPLHLTWSCYQPEPGVSMTRRSTLVPCARCDACRLRAQAFADLQMKDPALEVV